ncbi:MAG: radical SAM protein [Desulforhopalus sp.]|nr:radical SAM protein [Desulforhopalus sp.]
MIIKEVTAKSILSASKIYKYVINPYVGCQHACSYCYARYMKRFTGHSEPWGEFVDVKINAAAVLQREIRKKPKDQVWLSGVCDPYQPLEEQYQLTRQCLEILIDNDWPIVVQTRSPLVLRDSDLLKKSATCAVGFSIPTADEAIRQLFEPRAPKIAERITALDTLHQAGIRTYAMIAPILPGAEGIMKLLAGKVDYIYVDRMNYHHADALYMKNRLRNFRTSDYFHAVSQQLQESCRELNIACHVVF